MFFCSKHLTFMQNIGVQNNTAITALYSSEKNASIFAYDTLKIGIWPEMRLYLKVIFNFDYF